MTLVLDATVGGASANAYGTAAEADAYFAGDPFGSAWTGAPEKKDQCLVAAARRLDEESFDGARATITQAREFPRIGAYDKDGNLISSTIIPLSYKCANFELAKFYMEQAAAGSNPTAASGLEAFSALQVGSISLTLRDNPAASVTTGLPDRVLRLLSGYVNGYDGRVHLVRG